jgi:hypothetical protein
VVGIQTKERKGSMESGRNCIKRGFIISTLHRILLLTELIKDEMMRVCTMHGGWLYKSGGKSSLGRPRRR